MKIRNQIRALCEVGSRITLTELSEKLKKPNSEIIKAMRGMLRDKQFRSVKSGVYQKLRVAIPNNQLNAQQQLREVLDYSQGKTADALAIETNMEVKQVRSALSKMIKKGFVTITKRGNGALYSLTILDVEPPVKPCELDLPEWMMPKVLTPAKVGNVRTIDFMDTAEPPRKVAQPRSLYV